MKKHLLTHLLTHSLIRPQNALVSHLKVLGLFKYINTPIQFRLMQATWVADPFHFGPLDLNTEPGNKISDKSIRISLKINQNHMNIIQFI